jgi:pimeloyl-ACP methyl ester carboxylesterase
LLTVSIAPESSMVQLGNIAIHLLKFPSPTADATPLLLLHGHTDLAWSWVDVAGRLARTHEVFAIDLRGHGDSGRGAYSLMHLISDIGGVIAALGLERPVIVGHSLGGQSAAQFSGICPEVPSLLVLIEAVGPPARPGYDDQEATGRLVSARERLDMLNMPVRSRVMPDAADAARRLGRMNPSLSQERLKFIAERNTTPVEGGVEWKFDPLTRDWIANHERDLAEERWSAVECPVLHVLGADSWDRFWKRNMSPAAVEEMGGPITDEELSRRLGCYRDHELVILDDCGHMVHFDQPERLAETIEDFLARRS